MDLSNKFTEEYEMEANLKLARICRYLIILLAVVGMLNFFRVFKLDGFIYPVLIFGSIVMFLPTLFYNVMKKKDIFFRYVVLTSIVVMTGVFYVYLSYHTIILLVFPVVVSCLYCDKKSVVYTMLMGIPVILLAHILAACFQYIQDEPLKTLKESVIYGALPRLLTYIAIAVICINMTEKIQKLVYSLVQKNQELIAEQECLLTSLSQMIESESQETGMHVKRVSEYTKILCRHLGFDPEIVWKVGLAAMMHDVGKILIPREILEKPGKLTNDEFDVIKRHTVYGKRMLENSPGELMQLSAQICYEHHERYDGKGYMGLAGEDISIYSRCVSVADVFDALVSWRPYKQPWSPEEARHEIKFQSGKQFDPFIVKIFDDNFDEFLSVFEDYPDSQEAIDTEFLFKNA